MAAINHADIPGFLKQRGGIGLSLYDQLIGAGHDAGTLKTVIDQTGIQVGADLNHLLITGQRPGAQPAGIGLAGYQKQLDEGADLRALNNAIANQGLVVGEKLQQKLDTQAPAPQFGNVNAARMSPIALWAASQLGITGLDSKNDLDQINTYLQNNEDPYSQQLRRANDRNDSLQNELETLAIDNRAALDKMSADNKATIDGIIGQNKAAMEALSTDFTSTINKQASQLRNISAAYEEQSRLTANLARASTPAPNPSADVPNSGDNRNTGRRTDNNSLSSLAILSGLGSASNPMSGMQLA